MRSIEEQITFDSTLVSRHHQFLLPRIRLRNQTVDIKRFRGQPAKCNEDVRKCGPRGLGGTVGPFVVKSSASWGAFAPFGSFGRWVSRKILDINQNALSLLEHLNSSQVYLR